MKRASVLLCVTALVMLLGAPCSWAVVYDPVCQAACLAQFRECKRSEPVDLCLADLDACNLTCVVTNPDPDNDGINTDVDNCPYNYNPGQEDIDCDGIGNVCDSTDNPETNSCTTVTIGHTIIGNEFFCANGIEIRYQRTEILTDKRTDCNTKRCIGPAPYQVTWGIESVYWSILEYSDCQASIFDPSNYYCESWDPYYTVQFPCWF